jgi:putative addiction module component (TIGR02574 family)
MSVERIQNEALELPALERARLIDLLWDSLAPEELKTREAAWAAESERRIVAFEAGQIRARDAKEVLANLRKGLR